MLPCAGDVHPEAFSLLCKLDWFNLQGNSGIDKDTLVGFLSCNFTNLKDKITSQQLHAAEPELHTCLKCPQTFNTYSFCLQFSESCAFF